MRLQFVGQYLVYLGVRLFICVIQALPVSTCQGIARSGAWLLGDVLRIRRRVVLDNLTHAFPEMSDAGRRNITRQMWQHLLLLVIEVAHAPRKIHQSNWRDYVRLNHAPELMTALLAPRPVVLVTGHHGNFELGGFILGLLGFPCYAVARTLDNPFLDRFLGRFRGATGQHIIPKKGGYEQILDVLTRGETMCFLADQFAGQKGCWVDFFGRPASTHKAIALLALEHDAPLTVCYTMRRGQPLVHDFDQLGVVEPSEFGGVRELTAWYTRRLELAIRRAPGQYWWLHRRWKPRRPRKAQRQAQAA